MADLTKAADATQECIDFLLSMLADLLPGQVTLLGPTMPSFKLSFYKQTATQLAAAEPVIAALVATGRERKGVYAGRMEAIAHAAAITPDGVQHVLQRLAAAGHVHLDASREPAVALWLKGRPEGLPAVARTLHGRLCRLQQQMVRRLY
jgi:hypothetical protein